MIYRLNKDIGEYNKGEIFETKDGSTWSKPGSPLIFSTWLAVGLFDPVEEGWWKPKDGDDYWYFDDKMLKEWEDTWEDNPKYFFSKKHELRYASGNCFKHKSDAEFALNKVKELLISLHK